MSFFYIFKDCLPRFHFCRLCKLGVKGKCITLKFMMRSADAPKETSKHLGHGICDSVSKSRVLANFTDDLGMIKREVGQLLADMRLDHTDMRGLGIQISKLETTSGSAANAFPSSIASSKGTTTKSILSFVQKMEPGETTSRRGSLKHPDPEAKNVKSPDHPEVNLSFSQLDPEVLAALPEDIRKEIIADVEKKKKTTTQSIQEPGPSRFNSGGFAKDVQKKRTIQNPGPTKGAAVRPDPNPADLSFSQLDPEFLAALPPDLVAEVKQQYTKVVSSRPPEPSTAFDKIMRKIPPGSATMSKPSSPITSRKRRGRPPKNSPRFIKRSKKGDPPPISPPKVARALFDESSPTKDFPVADIREDLAPLPPTKKPANIEGRRLPSEVRDLLKAWISSTDNPTQDDIGTVSGFLQDLVEEREIESVSVILRSFSRMSKDQAWTDAYADVEDRVQLSMLAHYGAKIFTEF